MFVCVDIKSFELIFLVEFQFCAKLQKMESNHEDTIFKCCKNIWQKRCRCAFTQGASLVSIVATLLLFFAPIPTPGVVVVVAAVVAAPQVNLMHQLSKLNLGRSRY